MTSQITIRVSTAWWLPLYMRGLAAWCRLTRSQPNYGSVERIVRRAVRTGFES
ncbi:hypothetical protein G3O00_01760 [Burkholderia sp. Ac-20384]|uniref:hypothetical protein n=1 Tax=Burkholderia sp. Ac-20384 TaxID=2703902 RepID=UPI0019808D52|nr:hypothetical protein [Burkholderia sp. Ac-20384]MBN3822342.1 hypothetical protein [Burkholderia sp. Ac-20384]